MSIAVLAILVAAVLILSCGQEKDTQNDSPAPAYSLQPTAIKYPELTETGDQFNLTYPCSYMLHTFYNGHEYSMGEALKHLGQELDSYLPKELFQPPDDGERVVTDIASFGLHSPERLIPQLLDCHWENEKRDEIEKAGREKRREGEERLEDIRRQIREYSPP